MSNKLFNRKQFTNDILKQIMIRYNLDVFKFVINNKIYSYVNK